MIDLDEIEARAADVYPQDAGWSGYEAQDALPVVTKDVPALVAEVRRLRADLATARAALTGSLDAPTDDELAAHTGAWLARLYNGAFATMTATAVRNARGVLVRGGPYAVRWWALDPSGGFCPRPVVTTVAATLDAGPRDADGREVTP